MKIKIAINGFGRIGRLALRNMVNNPNLECVAINDLVASKTLAHLLKYDSAHGIFQGEVNHNAESLVVNGKNIPVLAERDPAALPWKQLGVDVVLECTGFFTSEEAAGKHLQAGAKKVIISAPAKGNVPTFVIGVNHETYDAKKHHVVSNASCTTNCLAPLAKVLHETFGIEHGFMTTIHSYTNDQSIVDAPHSDLRRARAAAVSQIPTTTGAAKAVGLVLPELAGKLDGMAIRVPTVNVSCVDLVATLKKEASAEEINAALKKASEGSLKNILGYCEEPLVSVDFMGNPLSSVIDAASTKSMGKLVKVLSWYDNEAGFSNRILQLADYMGKQL
ncbi:MAG: type I glyceraldehyde-3-phosphate dehydrogenase [Deltaproteobacteria bacterium CG_4_10_14_0_2_um_filter_43_8]|nr:MAG: type I glyceraldehyde-3-phosphate dehydrogenase [Deltaproteobacteria bacterium CG11_big_fil_rev_8_21_14_0_20_42_23]PJA22228.1 MAG: type I glyceraldehyde-3-phosphate dehydrogenase [Deltaproteobacteria bacterium CG_4_10_14_0_2_um_filter_43_8]PJC63895.1 MAG: type I glyceraldehyde-3-phosphate dehydrogenase [Deltaproteobacteria bacterium CG_4_9_14_0_2_um_filter_42_21]